MFEYKTPIVNFNYKTSHFTNKSEAVSVKFSFEPGIYLTSVAEYDKKNISDYSIHYIPYVKLGPELLLIKNTFINCNLGIIAPIHNHGVIPYIFGGISMLHYLQISGKINVEIETGVLTPFPLYMIPSSFYFTIGAAIH